jgi:MATE family, multidrug efflux pump
LSNAAATLVGQNLGAQRPDRAEKAVWRTGLYNMIFLGAVGVFFILFAEPVVRLFTSDPEIIPLGAACLRIVSYGNLGYAYFMVMMQAFNGAGDTITPTIVNFFGFWLLEIPLAYFLAMRVGMHSNGVFASIAIAESSMALASAALFKQGKWKLKKI